MGHYVMVTLLFFALFLTDSCFSLSTSDVWVSWSWRLWDDLFAPPEKVRNCGLSGVSAIRQHTSLHIRWAKTPQACTARTYRRSLPVSVVLHITAGVNSLLHLKSCSLSLPVTCVILHKHYIMFYPPHASFNSFLELNKLSKSATVHQNKIEIMVLWDY